MIGNTKLVLIYRGFRNRAYKKLSENKGEDFLLTFNTEGSLYTKKETEENYGYSWGEEDDIFIRNHKTKMTRDIRILLGKKY